MPGKIESVATKEKSIRRRIPKWALHSNGAASNEQYYLRSIGRALEVLDCFDGKASLALKEIGVSTGLPESTLFRVLLTLEKHGYLKQAVDGTYQLAPKLRFGWLVEQGNILRDKVHPELERLAQQVSSPLELCSFATIRSPTSVKLMSSVGRSTAIPNDFNRSMSSCSYFGWSA